MNQGINESDVTFIKNLLLQLSDNQKKNNEKVSIIAETVSKLETRILGDKEYQQSGLVDDVIKLNKYVENDKNQKNRVYGGLIVVGVVWTLIWEYIKSKF